MRAFLIATLMCCVAAGLVRAQNTSRADESARVLALDNSWNRALETNDTKALDLLLDETFVSIDIDGSMQTKKEFLASLKSAGYQAPSQAVTERSGVEVYGDSAVVQGIFRTKNLVKGKTVTQRERFLDTWVNINHTWKCVASVAVLIPAN